MKQLDPNQMTNLFLSVFILCFCLIGYASAQNQEKIQLGKDDRCPVCAMKVALYPKFACIMELADGRSYSFCSTGCMIRSWFHPEIYLKAPKSDIRSIWVQDYFTGQKINGVLAIWVAGSDVIGPMGPAMVPLKSERDAEAFKRRHGGTTMFHLRDLTEEQWREIANRQSP